MIRHRVLVASAIAVAMLAAACGDDDEASSPSSTGATASTSTAATTSSAATTSTSTDPFANPSVDGSFTIGNGRALALQCWGEGSPTIILEPGDQDAGVARFRASAIARDLAATNQVCAYDRAGLGNSDEPPARPRSADDMANDLEELLTVAEVEPPYVYVGSSFGGPIAMRYAALHRVMSLASSCSTFRRTRLELAPLPVPADPDRLGTLGAVEWQR